MKIEIREIVAAVFLGANAVLDIRRKRICLISAAGAAAAGVAFDMSGGWSTPSFLLGVAPGVFLVFLSLLSAGSVGMGDGIAAAAAGILLGPMEALGMCSAGSIFAAVYAGILWVRKKNGKAALPFVPFLFGGLIVTVLIR